MEFEQFKAFMLRSAAGHDARIAAIEESLKQFAAMTKDAFERLTRTTQVLVDNQVHLQERLDQVGQRLDDVGKRVDQLTVYSHNRNTAFDKQMQQISDRLDRLTGVVEETKQKPN